jgi:hypothetical protein
MTQPTRPTLKRIAAFLCDVSDANDDVGDAIEWEQALAGKLLRVLDQEGAMDLLCVCTTCLGCAGGIDGTGQCADCGADAEEA